MRPYYSDAICEKEGWPNSDRPDLDQGCELAGPMRPWSAEVRLPPCKAALKVRKLCEIARVPAFGFHAVRHAGASLMEKAGVPIGTIQRILGHESRKTTEVYLHSVGDAEREAIVVFEREATRIHTPIDSPWIN